MSNNFKEAKQETDRIHSKSNGDEITISELLLVIWIHKWLILGVTTLSIVLSVIYAITQPNIYKSEVLLAPSEQEQSSSISSLGGQLGGLASLAGVSFGSGGSVDKTQLALEILQSRKFVGEFIKKHDILADLMAAKTWERESNEIKYDDEIYLQNQGLWVRKTQSNLKAKPSLLEAYQVFREIMKVNIDNETGMTRVSIEHLSPYLAKKWVDCLVEDINQVMKSRDIDEATKSTAFLTQQLSQTNVADIRTVLYKLIEEQAKTIMFANVRDEYAFTTIDPAVVPEEKLRPKRVFIVVFGLVFGGFLGVFIALVRHFTKSK